MLHTIRSLHVKLDDGEQMPFFQRYRFGLIAATVTLLVYLAVFFARIRTNILGLGSDGHYIYLWCRSIVFDQDINFINDYKLCTDPFRLGIVRGGTGHPDNPFYVGPTLFWAPVMLVARALTFSNANLPLEYQAGCLGTVPLVVLASTSFWGAGTVWLSYLSSRRFCKDVPSAIAASLFGLCSPLFAYSTILPSYSHTHEAFALSILLYSVLRSVESPYLLRWQIAAGVGVFLCVLQRPPDSVFVLIPLAATIFFHGSFKAHVGRIAISLAGLGLGFAIQFSLYHYLYGHPFVLPQGKHFIHLAHAQPWLLLFAPRGGLFFTTPIAWLSCVGMILGWKIRSFRWLLTSFVFASAAILVVSSSPLDWYGAWSIGARRLIVLTPILIVCASIAIQIGWNVLRICMIPGMIGVFAFITVGQTVDISRGRLDPNDPSQAEQYGGSVRGAFSLLDEYVGDVFVLPGSISYRLRFGLPLTTWRAATSGEWYNRNYRSMEFANQDIPLLELKNLGLTKGFASDHEGIRLLKKEGFVVFGGLWPFATHIRLRVRSASPVTFSVAWSRWFSRSVLGERTTSGQDQEEEFEFPLDRHVFSNGLNRLEITGPTPSTAELQLISLRIEDTNVYPPSFE